MIAPARGEATVSEEQLASIRDNLCTLYRELDRDLARLGPICELSGRCCRFQEYGHTLFISEPEARLFFADAPVPVRPLDDGQSCPWQDANNRCTARDARPLGCRIFFCDPAFDEIAPRLTERYLGKLKQLANQHGWSWNYAPLHRHLQNARAEGRLRIAAAPLHGDRNDDMSP
ncbi:MAG: hypothetical protein ACP5XB_03335 [Isosphaeraceae bacterium]